MRACVIDRPGTLDELRIADVADPPLPTGRNVRVRVHAAALNHLDLFVLHGLPSLKTFPHILGADGAGVIDATGPDVSGLEPGDPVMINPGISDYTCEYCRAGEHSLCVEYRLLGEHLPGTLAEYVVVPDHNVVRIPLLDPALTWAEAAAFSLVTLTAWRLLVTRAALAKDETVLIWGIGSGVSLAALAIAKLLGARAIVTSSSDAKLEHAQRLGADVGLNHRSQSVAAEVRRLTAGGAHVVLDSVGEATWEESLRALRKKCRLVTCGATSGPRVVTDARRLFWNQYSIMGSTMGNAAEYRAIVDQLAAGRLRPAMDPVYPLADARSGFARLERGDQLGKIAISLRD